MNSVWKEARQRATAETLDLLKINSFPRVMLTIGTPVVAFAATARLTGQIAIAAMTALAWMGLCGGIIFAAKLICAPARIAQEERNLLATLNAGRADVDRIRQNRLEMARLLSAAEHFKQLCASIEPVSDETINLWFGDCVAVLQMTCGDEAVHSFQSEANTPGLVLMSPEVPQRNKDLWAWLNRRVSRLDLIYQAMPRA